MANYEQKIFEQVIDSYFVDDQNAPPMDEEVNLNGVNFKVKPNTNGKSENGTTKKSAVADNQKKKRESKSKAVLIEAEYHENLPEGWKKVVVQRTTGATAGKYDVYFFTPSGRKLRSKNEIKDYSEKHQLNLDLANFGFSRPRREKEKTASTKHPSSSKKSKSKAVIAPPLTAESNSVSIDSSDLSCSVNDNSLLSCGNKSSDENVVVVNTHSTSNGDNSSHSNCAGAENLLFTLSNIDEELRSLTEVLETPVELDLPNTSFTNSSSAVAVGESVIPGESVQLDIDQSQLGKTFKIERPLSFSCF